jgi:beta-lactam-binding protein with PASTA domain
MTWRDIQRRAGPYLIVSACGVALAWLVVLLFIAPASAAADEGTLPNMIGLTYDDASARLRATGFKVTRGESRFHASAPASTVLSQNPPAGSVQTKGTTVILDVSLGQKRGNVPALVGMPRDQAAAAIDRLGFDLGDVTERTSGEPRGTVLAEWPSAGTLTVLPARVNLVVSSGPPDVGVPDLLMQQLLQARQVLEQLGLGVGAITWDSLAPEPQGSVIGQSPAAGQAAPSGSKVDLKVAGHAPPPPSTGP